MRGLSLVAASGGHSSSRCAGLSPSRPPLLRSTGSRRAGSAIVAHGRSCSAACGIFPDQGSNPRPLHWQADSQPLRHQGSPLLYYTRGSTLNTNLHITSFMSQYLLGRWSSAFYHTVWRTGCSFDRSLLVNIRVISSLQFFQIMLQWINIFVYVSYTFAAVSLWTFLFALVFSCYLLVTF